LNFFNTGLGTNDIVKTDLVIKYNWLRFIINNEEAIKIEKSININIPPIKSSPGPSRRRGDKFPPFPGRGFRGGDFDG